MRKIIISLGLLLTAAFCIPYQIMYKLHVNQVVRIEPYMKLDFDMPMLKIHLPFGHKYGHGSGVLIGSQGLVLTARHMTNDSSLFYIQTREGKGYKAVLVAKDARSDLALLRIIKTTDTFSGVSFFGHTPFVGDSVFHIGNPIDLHWFFAVGRVSEINGKYTVSDNVVNPGSSGGPLYNRQGQLIGICSALATLSPFPAWAGHSLFVPIKDIKRFLDMWEVF